MAIMAIFRAKELFKPSTPKKNGAQSSLSVIIVKAILRIFLINGQNGGSEVLCRVT